MLAVRDVHLAFGHFRVLRGVSLEAPAGAITGLVGPNGSGKSTLMDVISGVRVADSGGVQLDGRPVPRGRPDLVAACGIGRTFQVPRLARRLTVFQNLLAAVRDHPGERLADLLARPRRVRVAEARAAARAAEMLDRLTLGPVADEYAGHLSGGQQKLLALGVLLMGDPRVLLLDEPAAGVNPALVGEQVALLRSLAVEGRTVLLVEHNMAMVSDVCDRVVVLHAGEVIARGTPAEILRDRRVARSYLGELADPSA
jgi:ABC-type branched-subunit amino acid transport system ATPase component